jgi:hypothetical protein
MARAGFACWIGPRLAPSWADHGESGPQRYFEFKSFFQLNKSVGENTNGRNTWGSQKNVKFYIEINLNICHNFCIGHFD